MRRKSPQGLDLAEIVNLLDGIEMIFHALDCNIFARLYTLGLEHFGERTFSLFGNESIF